MRREMTGSNRFIRGLLLYVLIFLLLAAAALTALTLFLRDYEATRPAACVRAYLADGAQGKLGYGWGRCLAGLDRNCQSEEELRTWVGALLENASFREILSEDSETRRYALSDTEGTVFEELLLEPTEADFWGLSGWRVAAEQCRVDAYVHSVSLRVPPDYTVKLGETSLDERFITRERVPYTLLEPFTGYVSNLPTLVEYQAGPYLGEQALRVFDDTGRELSREELDEYRYLDGTCSQQDEERVHDFVRSYLDAYLPYAGDLNRSGMAYWDRLYPMIVHGGALEQRLIQTREGFGFGNTNSIEVLSDDIRLCARLEAGAQTVYVVDMDYRIETIGLHGPVQEDNSLRLLIAEIDGELYVQSMYSY